MENSVKLIAKRVAEASNNFEQSNTELKRRYLVRNILAFNIIASKISVSRGSFGTGYPFYALKTDLTGNLPIIDEQFRYNNKLTEEAESCEFEDWACSECLPENYDTMPDLKQICKPCPNMDDGLKPRKIINRLPDMDMWMICEDGKLKEASESLARLLNANNIHTSDVNPLQTIQEVEEISENIKNGIMPKKFLPIDAHIMEYSKIRNLIAQVPQALGRALPNNKIPYLPIHPLSLRKTWQYDDEAYNFIHDYLSSLTEFNVDNELANLLTNTRKSVANSYSSEQLYKCIIDTGADAAKRRFTQPALRVAFEDRLHSWKQKSKAQDEPEGLR